MASMMENGIFNHPRPKKSLLPTPNKRRKIEHKIDEIKFEDDKRADYLTGFHKRKVQRTKLAKEEAAKKEKEERVVMRRQLREERRQELAEHIEAVNSALKAVEGNGFDFDKSNNSDDSWQGIKDDVGGPEMIDHEEEYVDEDKYTTVTVEAVDISKEGLQKVIDSEDENEDAEVPKWVDKDKEAEKEKKKWPKKPKKQKFRYESKGERKATRQKQKSSNKARADARKGDS